MKEKEKENEELQRLLDLHNTKIDTLTSQLQVYKDQTGTQTPSFVSMKAADVNTSDDAT